MAGVTYTLSLWISTAIVNDMHTQTLAQGSYTAPFTEQLPLALFGYANACVPFPIGTMDCIGLLPGWSELGRVDVQPAWDWTRVSITFTPAQDIHSIMIGGACDTPASFGGAWITDPQGETYPGTPYFLVDDLMLTIAADQVLLPVATSGGLCSETALAVADPSWGPRRSVVFGWGRTSRADRPEFGHFRTGTGGGALYHGQCFRRAMLDG